MFIHRLILVELILRYFKFTKNIRWEIFNDEENTGIYF